MTTTAKSTARPTARKRVPAEERREDVLRAAAQIVARDGMHAASTASIAKAAGMSHAYLFRLFPTKDELLLAVSRRCGTGMMRGMLDAGIAAKARGEDPLVAMGLEWTNQLSDHTNLLVSLQSITASRSMPALGDELRATWGEAVFEIGRISGAGPDEVRAFVAQGMLLQVIAALGAEQSDWASWLHNGPLPCSPSGGLLADVASDPEQRARVAQTLGRPEPAGDADAGAPADADAGAPADARSGDAAAAPPGPPTT